ncbi:MAG: hypothetical protein JRC87_00970 [Deltaproteobacteria bacterium]|nr:hypothetical protein [Deltaproteobacteria bacterium]MBW2658161.1 hypothetical protein [Deltaproteobacteria bacterium]
MPVSDCKISDSKKNRLMWQHPSNILSFGVAYDFFIKRGEYSADHQKQQDTMAGKIQELFFFYRVWL